MTHAFVEERGWQLTEDGTGSWTRTGAPTGRCGRCGLYGADHDALVTSVRPWAGNGGVGATDASFGVGAGPGVRGGG
jgi:hypothetical protein